MTRQVDAPFTAPVSRGAQLAARLQPQPRSAWRHFRALSTRWLDNDAYGHLNNVVYYSLFDSTVNGWLVEAGVLDVARSPSIGLVVESGCAYFAPLAFPQALEAGLRVARHGRSSVRYEVGVFEQGASHCAAAGHFTHVWVDRATRQPVPLPAPLVDALQALR